jgi:IS30 family transposase
MCVTEVLQKCPGGALRSMHVRRSRVLLRAVETIIREEVSGIICERETVQRRSWRCRNKPCVTWQLDDPALWETVHVLLQARWPPEQITLTLEQGFLSAVSFRLSYETIYSMVCPVPRGELRKDLVGCSVSARAIMVSSKRGSRGGMRMWWIAEPSARLAPCRSSQYMP